MKKIVLIILIMILCATPVMAESLPNAHAVCDVRDLQRFAGFTMDEETGEWYVHAQETEALLNYLPKAVADLNEFGLCYFSLGGNSKTGMLWLDMKVLYHQNVKNINAISASIHLRENRYDMVLQMDETGIAGVEAYSVRLGKEGYDLLCEMAAAETLELEIIGDYVYKKEVEFQEKENGQAYLSNYMVCGLQGALKIAQEIGVEEYALWDLSIRATSLRKSALIVDERLNEFLGQSDRLCVMATGSGVKAYQTLLRDKGYLAGGVDNTFGSAVQQATLNVQRYAGLLETGCADAETILYLLDGVIATPQSTTVKVARAIETDQYTLNLSRYWYASRLEASNAQDWLSIRETSNADNTLLIIEGEILNHTCEELYLPSVVAIEVTIDGVQILLDALVEVDMGQHFENTMGALQCKRVLLCAEVSNKMANAGSGLIVNGKERVRMGE